MFASLIVFRVIFCAVRGSGSMLRQGMLGVVFPETICRTET